MGKTLENTKAEQHNGYLDLLKFIFSLIIMGLHLRQSYFDFDKFMRGYVCVDFFFLVSGYFIVKSAMKARNSGSDKNVISKYFISRVAGFFPLYLVATVYSTVITELIPNHTIISTPRGFAQFIFDMIPMQLQGFVSNYCTGVLWYVNALFLVMPFLFAFVYKYGRTFSLVFAPIVSTLFIGFLFKNVGTLQVGWYNHFLFSGLLRAFGVMFLAAMLYEVSEYLKTMELTRIGYIIMRIFRIALLCVAFYQTTSLELYCGDFIFLLSIVIYLMLLFAYPVTCPKWCNKIFTELGKISIVLFMIHTATGRFVNWTFPELSREVRVCIYYFGSIVISYIIYYSVNAFMNKKILQRIFIKKRPAETVQTQENTLSPSEENKS